MLGELVSRDSIRCGQPSSEGDRSGSARLGLVEEGLEAFGERRHGRYILTLAGKIDLATADQFKDALRHAMSAPERVVVVDLSKVDYIDSTGLTALMEAEMAAQLDVDPIQFVHRFHPEVEAVLRVSGVYDELKFIEPETLNQSNDR